MAYIVTLNYDEESFEDQVKDLTDDELRAARQAVSATGEYDKLLIISIEIKRREHDQGK